MSTTKPAPSGFALDGGAFRGKIPYSPLSTNLTGGFASPAPPDGFDPNTANAAELVKSGLLWRRPAVTGNLALVNAWKTVFSRTWLAKDGIVPQFETQTGKTHALKKPLIKVADQNFVNGAWPGAGIRGGKWTGVIGFRDIPLSASPPSHRAKLAAGIPPRGSVSTALTSELRRTMCCRPDSAGSSGRATFAGNSIEWIMEAPDGGEPITAPPKFTPVQFTSAIGCNASGAVGNPQSGDTANIETTGGKLLTKVAVGNDTVTIDFIG